MRVVFLNPNPSHPYDAATPLHTPLAGSETAQCHLAAAVAARGHDVRMVTATPAPSDVRGVRCLPLAAGPEAMAGADAVVVTNDAAAALDLRRTLPATTAVFAWEHNFWQANAASHDEALQALLADGGHALCVSDWHRDNYVTAGGLDPARVHVLRNAIAPAFAGLFAPGDPILRAKAWPPLLAFTSVPYKGLEGALSWFGRLRGRQPAVTLNVFSSFDLYPADNQHRHNPVWPALYDRCRTQPGVNYVGVVPQPRLARALRGVSVLFYPSVVPETSGIAVMEAMAAGCLVITVAQGALPETLAGFGVVVEPRDEVVRCDDFLAATEAALSGFADEDARLEAHLRRQVDHITTTARWERRAEEFEALLARIAGPGTADQEQGV